MMDKTTAGVRQKIPQPPPISPYVARVLENAASFSLAALAAFAITMSAAFYDSFSSIRLGATLLAVLLLHIQFCPRVLICREFVLYICFVVYMFVELLWTNDITLAMNTLVPAVNFIVILILFGSLMTFYNVQAVLAGALGGALAGAAIYTALEGFPFRYPIGFSYNVMALLYLFGLFLTLLLSCFLRSKSLLILIGLVLMSLILATTSIKANLGILLGASLAFLVYFGYFKRVLAQNLLPLVVLVALLGFALASNDAIMESIGRGMRRVSLGIDILQAREGIQGYGGFESRSNWLIEGIKGWVKNPVFGYGVEAFRSRLGMTSHSTPIDLLYNSGLIGFILFYSIFVSILWRLRRVRDVSAVPICALIFGTVVCYLLITLSGTMHYKSFLAAFIGISAGILRRYEWNDSPVEYFDAELR